jgi:hypothetical protein
MLTAIFVLSDNFIVRGCNSAFVIAVENAAPNTILVG